MLYICFNIYNEAEYLEEALKAVKGKGKIVIVDGAYKKFPHQIPYSTDGSLEIAKKYTDIIIETKEPWQSEIFKRNQYLIGKEGDTYLVIDGHEIWKGDLTAPFGNYRIKWKLKDGWHEAFRMFKHAEGIHYQRAHYEIWIGDKEIGTDFPVYPHGHLIHKDVKSKERIKNKEYYYSLKAFDN